MEKRALHQNDLSLPQLSEAEHEVWQRWHRKMTISNILHWKHTHGTIGVVQGGEDHHDLRPIFHIEAMAIRRGLVRTSLIIGGAA